VALGVVAVSWVVPTSMARIGLESFLKVKECCAVTLLSLGYYDL
jgi:hypothetical protein